MTSTCFPKWISRKGMLARRLPGKIIVLAFALGGVSFAGSLQGANPGSNRTAPIPVSEFSRIVQEFSEEGGYFPSDNFTSNETPYLDIVGKLQEMGISGGAYIGVGPEQNFTYIAKIRPQIAFIVDIRRQAVIQHLLYKAIFHLAKNRTQFLSWLFSKPLPKTRIKTGDSLEELLNYISEAPTTPERFLANLTAIRKTIEENFQFPLSPEDRKSLEYVYNAFWQDNLGIGFRFGNGVYIAGSWGFPTLRDLILATDLNGKRGNFLAQEEDYRFVRKLQEQNRVIPVVGDFAGTKALTAVANYLRKNGYIVSTFYSSNVEEFLYENEVYGGFAENIRKLPISDRSAFIRVVRRGWAPHSFWVPGDRMTPFFQKISVFLKDYTRGLYPDYRSLVTTHYISGTDPRREVSPSAVSH